MSSSLSRAVQQGGNATSNASSKLLPSLSSTTQAGKFEACFAQGLDLSDFSSQQQQQQSQSPVVSASAQLLKIKQEGLKQRHEQEKQDADMEQLAQNRAQQLQAELQQQPNRSVNATALLSQDRQTDRDRFKFMGSLLAQMHQTDDTPSRSSKASLTLRKKQQSQAKRIQKQTATSRSGGKKKAPAVAKHRKRSKY